MGTRLRGVATVDSFLAVQEIQPFVLFLLPWIHHPDDAGHRRIRADEVPVPADTGGGATEAVDTTRRLFIPGKLLGRNSVLRHTGGKFFRLDDVGFCPVDTLWFFMIIKSPTMAAYVTLRPKVQRIMASSLRFPNNSYRMRRPPVRA